MTLNPFRKMAEAIEAAAEGFWNLKVLATGQRKVNRAARAYMDAKQELVSMSYEAIDSVNQLPTGGDEAKEKIRRACLADIADLNVIVNQVMNGRLTPDEGVGAISAAPLEPEPSETSSEGELKAIEHAEPTNGTPTALSRRPVGRPKGSKNRRVGQGGENGQVEHPNPEAR